MRKWMLAVLAVPVHYATSELLITSRKDQDEFVEALIASWHPLLQLFEPIFDDIHAVREPRKERSLS
jgi:hypothetical protein